MEYLFAFLESSNAPVVITDALQPGYPIVFVNAAFERITGYGRAEVAGRNCRFLQGSDRDQSDRAHLAEALAHGLAVECTLRNYRKNGEMFWNKLYIFPMKDDDGKVTHFAGFQHDMTREKQLVGELEDASMERERLIDRISRKRAHTARLSRDLINAQEAERKALARELHDELGQRLSALNLLLHRALPYFDDDGGKAIWGQAERELGSLVGLVRDMSVSLRPPGLDYFGLEPTIGHLLSRQFEGGPSYVFEYAGLPPRLDAAIEIGVFRLVQESVTNILRYAKARHVVVEVNGGAKGDEIEVIVRDDGVGFDATHWREHGARSGRSGLAGMSERVQLLGGSLRVDSAVGQGTRITATLPLLSLAPAEQK
ncbi:sensor histidine kinase [Massilia phyllosphaerae]|uniref:sensor histidine kinase n=1 Tax=Massilia phyllosphaerae TaxID=3106034 RepID=UPI002B1CD510|nr:PAS domain-containing protein [Massilia sp. SGZ-792]